MTNEEPRIQHIQSGIVCDNANCDFVDMTVKTEGYQDWIDKLCPKCGENLLSLDDLQNNEMLHEIINILNSKSDEELEELAKSVDANDIKILSEKFGIHFGKGNDNHVEMQVKVHDGIQIESINQIDNEQIKYIEINQTNMEKAKINSAIKTLQILRNKISIKLLKIIEKEGSLTGLELQEKTFLPQSRCSEFLNKLEKTGVLTREKKGRKVYFYFNKSRYEQIERMVREIG